MKANQSIIISLYKAQVQVDQGLPNNTRYTESNIRESWEEPQTHGHRGNFLNRIPMVYALRSTINKWNLIKSQCFSKAKDTINRTKQHPTDWENIFANPTS